MHHVAPTTPAERDEIAKMAHVLGVQRLAKELGVSRTTIASLIAGTASRATRIVVAPELARLRAELADHDRRAS